MGDKNDHLFALERKQYLSNFLTANEEATETLQAEKVAADKQAILAQAYRQMPEDMRTRAEEWGVRALMELVWMNGWDCGYRQSCRDQRDIHKPNN